MTTSPSVPENLPANVPSFCLPKSDFLSAETKAALQKGELESKAYIDKLMTMPAIESIAEKERASLRRQQRELFYTSPLYTTMTSRYPVQIENKRIAGVPVEVFTPRQGVPTKNKNRLLINIHGGGFKEGSQTLSRLESMPIAALAKTKVISIDYRMAPEHSYPAANDDIYAVYTALLSEFAAKNIGLYGCSAGALLAAQSLARFQQDKLPMPAALSMSCAAAHELNGGDSGHIAEAVVAIPKKSLQSRLYFHQTDPSEPFLCPGETPKILASFPPSQLIVGTRDYTMSSVVHTHAQLVKQNVSADLHVFEGMEHGILCNSDLPESQETYRLLVCFFDKYLSK